MRSTVTEISYMLFGASILIFILALLVPVLRELPAHPGKSETEMYDKPLAYTKPDLGSDRLSKPRSSTDSVLEPATTRFQSEISQDHPKALTEPPKPVDIADLSSTMAPNNTVNEQRGSQENVKPLQSEPDFNIRQNPEEMKDQANASTGYEQSSTQTGKTISLLVLGEGFFPFGEVTLRTNGQDEIDKIIPQINARPLDKVLVEGHADNWIQSDISNAQGSKMNQIVSLRRAEAVADVLKQKGVAPDRILVKGLGDTVPLASNLTKEGRAKNRRVEIKLSSNQ